MSLTQSIDNGHIHIFVMDAMRHSGQGSQVMYCGIPIYLCNNANTFILDSVTPKDIMFFTDLKLIHLKYLTCCIWQHIGNKRN